MDKTGALLIRDARMAIGAEEITGDIRIRSGVIEAVGQSLPADGAAVFDAAGLTALPGAVDSHVHFHMPAAGGGYNADDFTSGSREALCGGTTSYIDFASPLPGKSWARAVHARRAEADGVSYADYGLHMEVTGAFPQRIERLTELSRAGVRALKIYTTYGADRLPEALLEPLFLEAARCGYPILAHCEDDAILDEAKHALLSSGKCSASYHGVSRPARAEAAAAKKLIGLSARTGCTLIVAHISAAETGLLVQEARRSGLPVYGETCPHYLLLDERLYAGPSPQNYIMTPPLRTSSDTETLWTLVKSGDIGLISTDHCPFLLSDKRKEPSCFDAAFGVGGCGQLVTLLFSEGYQKGRLTLSELSMRLSATAARLYGLSPQKGALAPGADADIVLVDPQAPHLLSATQLQGRADYSIYEGFPVSCTVRCVFLRGRIAARDGAPVAPPSGRFLHMKSQPF